MIDYSLTKVTLLLLISILGGLYDLRSRRIPNWLTLGTFLLVLLFNAFYLRATSETINCLLGFLTGIALLSIPYLTGGMGAGDVKLLGTIGSLVGYKSIILIFVYSAICGLLFAIIWLAFTPKHFRFLITTGQILPTVDKKQKLPYGIAISTGTFLYIMFGINNFFNIPIWQ